MAYISRFVDRERLRRRVPSCPLATTDAGRDEGACAGCVWNLLAPGQAQIGCQSQTSAATLDMALSGLAARSPALHGELAALLGGGRLVLAQDASSWLRCAAAWFALLSTPNEGVTAGTQQTVDAEFEVCRVIARFARAASDQGEDVELLS